MLSLKVKVIIIIITLLDFTDSGICVDVVVVVVTDEHSKLPEISVVGSDCIVWLVVCSVVIGSYVVCSVVGSVVCSVVVGASHSIRKT